MQYTATKDVSLDGKTIRHYVTSPAGDVVCSTHTAAFAEALAYVLNTHGGTVFGTSLMEWDWAASNEEPDNAAT